MVRGKTGIISDERYLRHKPGFGHPERPERLEAIERGLTATHLVERCRQLPIRHATREEVCLVHSEEYFARVRAACESGEPYIDSPDSGISKEAFDTALLAAGGVLEAVQAVLDGEVRNAFAAVRPPGHHAEWDRSMGFCLFNNVAIAASYLREVRRLTLVLIFDFDVHHGNGTQHRFEDDPNVYFCSIHGHPLHLYPGSGFPSERGLGEGQGATLNIAMPPRSGEPEYLAALELQFYRAAREFEPEFVLISAGFDAHRSDPIGNQALDDDSFVHILEPILDIAEECCQGRVVLVLEGGYDLQVLERCVPKVVLSLCKSAERVSADENRLG